MEHNKNHFLSLLFGVTVALFSMDARAENCRGDADIEYVKANKWGSLAIKTKNAIPCEYDSSEKQFDYFVSPDSFTTVSTNRFLSLATAAILSGKRIVISFDTNADGSAHIREVYLYR